MKIIAKEFVGENAISMQSGQNLYEKISKPLLAGESVEIDFAGVELFASPFFNASLGLLIKDIPVKDLQQRMKITNLEPVGRQLLNHVISNAIRHFEKHETQAEEDLKVIVKNAEER